MRHLFKREPDPFAAGRYSEVFRSVRRREREHMRHWWQWALLGFLLAVIGVCSYGLYRYNSVGDRISDEGIVTPQEQEGEPFNVLLVGSDSREGLTEQEQHDLGANAVGGQRADTIILAHVDPDDDSVVLVQFPRDLYVDIAGTGGKAKINSALESGANRLINTVENLSGLTINRYVQVNIAGFRDLVDAIGGVEICIPEPIPFDPNTGIEVKRPGMHRFDGDRAIRFVRSRRFPTGDFERIRNQQKFLSAAVAKLTSASTFLRPDRIQELLDIAGDNVRTNADTSLKELATLLNRFRNFDPKHYEAYAAPNLGIGEAGGASIVVPDERAMEVMFDALAENRSPAEADGVPDIAPPSIKVGVYNAAGLDQPYAKRVADALEDATDTGAGPVDVVEIANAARFGRKKTVVRYSPDKPETENMAELVAAALAGADIAAGQTPEGVDVAVLVGRREVRVRQLVQILPIPIPPPGEVPEACRRG